MTMKLRIARQARVAGRRAPWSTWFWSRSKRSRMTTRIFNGTPSLSNRNPSGSHTIRNHTSTSQITSHRRGTIRIFHLPSLHRERTALWLTCHLIVWGISMNYRKCIVELTRALIQSKGTSKVLALTKSLRRGTRTSWLSTRIASMRMDWRVDLPWNSNMTKEQLTIIWISLSVKRIDYTWSFKSKELFCNLNVIDLNLWILFYSNIYNQSLNKSFSIKIISNSGSEQMTTHKLHKSLLVLLWRNCWNIFDLLAFYLQNQFLVEALNLFGQAPILQKVNNTNVVVLTKSAPILKCFDPLNDISASILTDLAVHHLSPLYHGTGSRVWFLSEGNLFDY